MRLIKGSFFSFYKVDFCMDRTLSRVNSTPNCLLCMIKRVLFHARVRSLACTLGKHANTYTRELASIFLVFLNRLGSCLPRIPFSNQPSTPRARHLSQTTAWLPTKLTFTTIFPINLQACAAT